MTNQLAVSGEKKPETRLQVVSNYFHAKQILDNFAGILGEKGAQAFVASVLVQVAQKPKLQECTTGSIYIAAMRAASLRLSVDPSTAQAYLIPYGKVCTFLPGYKGYMDMALRTHLYNHIHVEPYYEGEFIIRNRTTGELSIGGKAKEGSTKIEGYLGHFDMKDGYSKEIDCAISQIYEHAQRYSPGYRAWKEGKATDSPWGLAPEMMERKTVLRDLLVHWGKFNTHDVDLMDRFEAQITPTEDELKLLPSNDELLLLPPEEMYGIGEEQALKDLGYADVKPAQVTKYTPEEIAEMERNYQAKKAARPTPPPQPEEEKAHPAPGLIQDGSTYQTDLASVANLKESRDKKARARRKKKADASGYNPRKDPPGGIVLEGSFKEPQAELPIEETPIVHFYKAAKDLTDEQLIWWKNDLTHAEPTVSASAKEVRAVMAVMTSRGMDPNK